VWLLGRHGELLDSHLFYFDKYCKLADHHRRGGRLAKADRLTALAEEHFRLAPDDDKPPEPEAAAIAMPVQRPATRTRAVGTTHQKSVRSDRRMSSPLRPASEDGVSLEAVAKAVRGILATSRSLMLAHGHHGGVRDGSSGANRGSAIDGVARRLGRRGWDVGRAKL
jgi:hypothetical protein